MSRPRLAILTPDFPPAVGGIQHLLGQTAAGLADDWEVTVVAPRHPDAPGHDRDAPVRVVRTRAGWGGARSPAAVTEMAALGARARPDVVLAGHVVTMPAAFAAAHGRSPVAAYLYGSEVWAPAAGRILRALGPRCRRVLSISRYTGAEAQRAGVPADRLRLVPPGAVEPTVPADADERLAALGLEGVPYFLTLARLAEPHKGHELFIRALPALVARVPETRYVVAGDGPLRTRLERVARAAGVQGSVVFTGTVDEADKGALLARCRALAMVSREAPAAAQFEGFGIAYVEAALAGRPSLAGRAGGVPEVVSDGETGLLVDPLSVTETAQAALRLLEEPGLADRLGERAREVARRDRGWPAAVARVDAALREVA